MHRAPTTLYLHFLEEIPVRDRLQFLQYQIDAAFDKERLVLLHGFVQQLQVAAVGRLGDVGKLQQVKPLQEADLWHVTLKGE